MDFIISGVFMNIYTFSFFKNLKNIATVALLTGFALPAFAMQAEGDERYSSLINGLTHVYNYHLGNNVRQLMRISPEQKQQIIEKSVSFVLDETCLNADTACLTRAWEMVTKRAWEEEKLIQDQITKIYNYHFGRGVKQLIPLNPEQKQHIIEKASSLCINEIYPVPDTEPLKCAWEMVTKRAWSNRIAVDQLFLNNFLQQARKRTTDPEMNEEQFTICDLGYQGRARSEQYGDPFYPGNTYNMLNLPAAPILHPYDPSANFGHVAPAFTLNIKLQDYIVEFMPEIIHANLRGIAPDNIDTFVVFQDMPWRGAPLQFKPHYWLEPNAPTVSADHYGGGSTKEAHSYTIYAGVFSIQHPNVHIQRQPEASLLKESISIHNVGPGTPLRSSGNVLSIMNLDPNISQVLYSVVRSVDKNTGIEHAARVKHILLNRADERTFELILQANHNLADLKRGVNFTKINGGGFADLDLDEVF